MLATGLSQSERRSRHVAGNIRIGVGGWTFEPWRGVFYPKDVKQKDELAYASRHLTAIEINGTYYSTFKPDSWKKWRDETPEGFVFAVKGSRFTTNRRELAGAGESLERFFGAGRRRARRAAGAVPLAAAAHQEVRRGRPRGLLLAAAEGAERASAAPRAGAAARQLLHAGLPGAAAQARHRQRLRQAPPLSGDRRPLDRLRLRPPADRRGQRRDRLSRRPSSTPGPTRLKTWAAGGAPDDLPIVDKAHAAPKTPRDVFAFIIHEGKIRAPAGAMALIERVA